MTHNDSMKTKDESGQRKTRPATNDTTRGTNLLVFQCQKRKTAIIERSVGLGYSWYPELHSRGLLQPHDE